MYKYILSLLFFLLIGNALKAVPEGFLPVPSNAMVRHTYFVISYNEQYEQANWVYYVLTDSMVIKGGQERKNSFKIDAKVATGSAKSSDYTKTGYDRGHLCPAADMDFSEVAMSESFLMSNISPQTPDFNRGIWKELETEVRNWAVKKQVIHVVTGPVFGKGKGTIGESKVLVPEQFFKIIYTGKGEQSKIIAFVLPNQKSSRPLSDFAVTVDEAEKLTGFDFFSQLADNIEDSIEGRIDLSGWFSGFVEPEPPVVAQKSVNQEPKPDKNEAQSPDFYIILVSAILLTAVFVAAKGRKR